MDSDYPHLFGNMREELGENPELGKVADAYGRLNRLLETHQKICTSKARCGRSCGCPCHSARKRDR